MWSILFRTFWISREFQGPQPPRSYLYSLSTYAWRSRALFGWSEELPGLTMLSKLSTMPSPHNITQGIPLRTRNIPGPPWCYPGNSGAHFVIKEFFVPMGIAGHNRDYIQGVFKEIHEIPCCHSGNYRTNQGYSRESRVPRCHSGNSLATGVFQGFPDPRLSFQGVFNTSWGIPGNSRDPSR